MSTQKRSEFRLGLLSGPSDRRPVRPADALHEVFSLCRGSRQIGSLFLLPHVRLQDFLIKPMTALWNHLRLSALYQLAIVPAQVPKVIISHQHHTALDSFTHEGVPLAPSRLEFLGEEPDRLNA